MTRFTIKLNNCRTKPLSSYLKAIGLLRLVSEQLTGCDARGFWQRDCFHLASHLSEHDVIDFFLSRYSPTPLITPWNGGSGFYPKDQKRGIDAIVKSRARRLEIYRNGIQSGKELVGDRVESPKDEEKFSMLVKAKQRWRGELAAWLSAAMVLDTEGEPLYPALLGTGGNDGRLDFANNFMQRLCDLFDLESESGSPTAIAIDHLNEALFGAPIASLQSVAIGQFNPGAAGGMNSSNGFDTTPTVNLWDFVLMLEGTIAFAPSLSRRANADGLNLPKPIAGLPQAAAPFAVYNAAAGYATAVGDEKNRGEQWMPVWVRPTTYVEFRQTLSQARCRLPGGPAKRPRDIAKAIARAGTARGITAFERFAFLERNGQANLAAPIGRWEVGRPSESIHLLDEVEDWFSRFDRASNAGPESWKRAAQAVDTAIMNCCRPLATPKVWGDLAVALGRAEATIIANPRAAADSKLQPISNGIKGLSPAWALAMADRSSEVRLAISLASQYGPAKDKNLRIVPNRGNPLRMHLAPLASSNGEVNWPIRFAASDERLQKSNDVVVGESNVELGLAQLVQRRLFLLIRRNDWHCFPLVPTKFLEADVSDLAEWVEGNVDSDRMIAIARTLSAVNWHASNWDQRKEIVEATGFPSRGIETTKSLVRRHTGWALTRLCFHWDKIRIERHNESTGPRTSEHAIPCERRVFAALMSGDSRSAVKAASDRLSSSGVLTKFVTSISSPTTTRRWASSLAWSLSPWTISRIAEQVLNLASIKPSEFDDPIETTTPIS